MDLSGVFSASSFSFKFYTFCTVFVTVIGGKLILLFVGSMSNSGEVIILNSVNTFVWLTGAPTPPPPLCLLLATFSRLSSERLLFSWAAESRLLAPYELALFTRFSLDTASFVVDVIF